MKHTRLTIYPKDVQLITGKSERSARHLLKKIRQHFRKPSHQLITFDEFCSYTGLDPNKILSFLFS